MDILAISQNIIIVGGAIIIILGVVVMLLLVRLLLKLNSIVSDAKEKYNLAMSMLFKPFEFVQSLISKFQR